MTRENVRAVTVLVLMFVVPPLAYVGGYLLLSEYVDVPVQVSPRDPNVTVRLRAFDAGWLIPYSEPAAQVESRLTGIPVILYDPQSPFSSNP